MIPDPNAKKSQAQINIDAKNRKRKPLIDLNAKPHTEQLAAKDVEIAALNRQLQGMQEANTAKEAYIRELEDKLAQALNPPKIEPVTKTEEVPGTGRRRARVEPPAPPVTAPAKTEEGPKEPADTASPATADAPKPGDGIAEDD